MLEWFKRFLAPPVFANDEEKTRIARLFNLILLYVMGILIVAGLAIIFIYPERINRGIIILATFGLVWITRALMRRGHVRNAVRLFITGLGFAISFLVLFSGGITSANTIFYIMLAIITGLLLGSLATYLLTITVILTGVGMVLLKMTNTLPAKLFDMPVHTSLVAFSFALILSVSILNLALGNLYETRARYITELAERKQTEKALAESEQWFHAIYDSVNDAIFIHDFETGTILDINQRMCEMYGYTRQEALQLNINDLSSGESPYTLQDALEWIQKIPLDGSRMLEWLARDKNGRIFWVEVNVRHTNIAGQERLLVTVRDIGDRKKADQMRDALYHISDAARAAQDLNEFYQLLHSIICTLMPAKNFYVALYDQTAGLLSYPYFSDEYDQTPSPHQPDKGLTTYVLHSGAPLLVTPDIFEQLAADGVVENIGAPCVDWLGVPLKATGGVIGILAVQTYTEIERLTADDKGILIFISNQVAMMLERKQAEEHDRNFSRGLRAVIEAADELIRCDQLDTVFRRAVELARDKIGVERVGLFLLDDEGQYLTGTYGTDDQGHTTEEHTAREIASNHPYLFSLPDRLWNVRATTQAYWKDGQAITLTNGWIAGTVIRSLTRPIGVLFNDSAISKTTLNEAIQETLAVYCSLLGNIIDRKRLEERERDMVQRLHAVVDCADELIGCKNLDTLYRRAVELAREKLNAERSSIFLLDEKGEYLLGTFGTDNKGRTTDEHEARWLAALRPEIFAGGGQNRIIRQADAYQYWENGVQTTLDKGWVAFTLIRIANEPIGLFCNDCAISHTPPNETAQETIAIYCSLLGNIIDRKRSEERERDMVHRLQAVVDCADQLIGCENLDSLYRRAVELAREKLNVERCAIFLLDEAREYVVGTYGTNDEGQTSDEHLVLIPVNHIPEIFDRGVQKYKIHETVFPVYYKDGNTHPLNQGWVASTIIRIADEPIGVFYNDTAISRTPLDETIQETISIYCSLLGNIIKRMRAEAEQKTLIAELEAKNSELERFSYTVSHDLKAPLITIRGFLGFIEKDAATNNIKRLREDINRISEATNKMQRLLNDLLELSRIGRMMNPGQIVSFEDITREAINIVQGQIDACGAEVIIQEGLPSVFGDRARLVEVIQNLLDNAVKFSKHQINPRIEIGVREPDETGKPIFFVQDNGIGIDPRYHERIFGLFNKLDPQSDGTGIGLALVKRIIEFHGGRIWVESAGQEQGSTFYFTLPATGT